MRHPVLADTHCISFGKGMEPHMSFGAKQSLHEVHSSSKTLNVNFDVVQRHSACVCYRQYLRASHASFRGTVHEG